MTRIAYIEKKFKPDTRAVIEQADAILNEYRDQGYVLTLRQLYYQFVSRALIPNKQQEYSRLGGIINDARMAGLIDWEMLEDRTRGIERINVWDSPAEVLSASAAQYKIDLWADHEMRPEVWIEKEALAGVIETVCEENRVDYLSCRGYVSASEQWRAAQRIIWRWRNEKQNTLIIHLGDHDPSGIDMSRDNFERLETFCAHHLGFSPFKLMRIALNMDQVQEYNPPPNPAKSTDSRFADYASKHGDESWELDALEPSVINALILKEIETLRDPGTWNQNQLREEQEKSDLLMVSDRFDEAVNYLKETT